MGGEEASLHQASPSPAICRRRWGESLRRLWNTTENSRHSAVNDPTQDYSFLYSLFSSSFFLPFFSFFFYISGFLYFPSSLLLVVIEVYSGRMILSNSNSI